MWHCCDDVDLVAAAILDLPDITIAVRVRVRKKRRATERGRVVVSGGVWWRLMEKRGGW